MITTTMPDPNGTDMIDADQTRHRSDLHYNKFDRDKRMFYLRVVKWQNGSTRQVDPFPTERTAPQNVRRRHRQKRLLPSNAAYTRLGPKENVAELVEEARKRFDNLSGCPVGYVLCRVHLDDKPSYGTDEFGKPYRTVAGVEWFDRPMWPGEVDE